MEVALFILLNFDTRPRGGGGLRRSPSAAEAPKLQNHKSNSIQNLLATMRASALLVCLAAASAITPRGGALKKAPRTSRRPQLASRRNVLLKPLAYPIADSLPQPCPRN